MKKGTKLGRESVEFSAVTVSSTTLVPTLRTAAIPNLMSSPTAVNIAMAGFTSGVRTLMPIRRHSFRYSADLSLSTATEDSSQAMYTAGKYAFRHAVQQQIGA